MKTNIKIKSWAVVWNPYVHEWVEFKLTYHGEVHNTYLSLSLSVARSQTTVGAQLIKQTNRSWPSKDERGRANPRRKEPRPMSGTDAPAERRPIRSIPASKGLIYLPTYPFRVSSVVWHRTSIFDFEILPVMIRLKNSLIQFFVPLRWTLGRWGAQVVSHRLRKSFEEAVSGSVCSALIGSEPWFRFCHWQQACRRGSMFTESPRPPQILRSGCD